MNDVINRNTSIFFFFVDVNTLKPKQNGILRLFLTGHYSEATKL